MVFSLKLLVLVCIPCVISASTPGGPQFLEKADEVLDGAAAGFQAMGHKLHQALDGLALGEVAPTHRLHEAENLNLLSPLKHKAALFVIALTEFRISSESMGSSTILVLVLILGIPLAIFFCAAIYFLSDVTREDAKNSNPKPKFQYMGSGSESCMSPASRGKTLSASHGSHSLASSYSLGTSRSSASPPDSSGRLSHFKRPEADILCPALVVEQGGGVTLKINGAILPHRQEVVADVISLEHAQAVVVRMFLSEAGRDSGILIESATRFPLAFINTANAVNNKGVRPPKSRQVSISGSSPLLGAEPAATFAVAVPEGDSGSVVVRRNSKDGLLMYTISTDAEGGRIIDANGKQVAILKTNFGPDMVVWIGPGIDACMILCSVVAAAKLA